MKILGACFMLCASVVSRPLVAADWTPPSEIPSPDGRFSVRMLDKPVVGADSLYDYTIAIYAGERQLSHFPTTGYLVEAYWSPDGASVAVNNRRANSGDYLWVFSLKDGKAIKVPDDEWNDGIKAARALIQRVRAKFPECTYEKLDRYFITGDRWKSATELNVRTKVRFYHAGDFDVLIDDVYKLRGAHLVLETGEMRKQPWEGR